MSRALVIKGANFATNKLDTVTLQDIVPCTGISLSESSISYTAIGQTTQLTATVSPADTTDSVVWTSSDSNCVTVVNGLVTCVGVGTATITATCGTEEASCTVVASVSLDMSTVTIYPHKALSSTDLSADPPKDYLSLYGTESGASLRKATFYSTVETSSSIHAFNYNIIQTANYPIMLPNNTKHIEITIPSTLSFENSSQSIQFADSTKHYTYNLYANSGVLAKTNILAMTKDGKKASYDVPNTDGIDSFLFGLYLTSQIDSKPDGITVVFT